MMSHEFIGDVDDEIYRCLDLNEPRSFFLFAGAGSGKTRSLVEVLKRFKEENSHRLRVNAQQIAIITYTNAACEEINRRLEYDPVFSISTIHSFSWELIKYHPNEIRKCLKDRLLAEISELEEQQKKGRPGTKASLDRPRQIATKLQRLKSLEDIRKFSYNPNGENSSKHSLNHAEVIDITATLLKNSLGLQKILVRKYPVLLIDESQDTKKELMESFFLVQNSHPKNFTLGLFGDIMQRIYSDGKENLGLEPLPSDWITPTKEINYRSPRRVVELLNQIRVEVDNNLQTTPRSDEGLVRVFIVHNSDEVKKSECEFKIAEKMADLTGDRQWLDNKEGYKTLTLEHQMAALRGGFSSFFSPLYNVDRLKTSLLDGANSDVNFFREIIIPLVNNLEIDNKFAIARIVIKHSPLVCKENLAKNPEPKAILKKAKEAVGELYKLWDDGSDPSLISILKEVNRSSLFAIPEILGMIVRRVGVEYEESSDINDQNPVVDAWDIALNSSFSEFKEYVSYVSDESRFGTHQGVKGLEFPRVMAIIDDQEARGFLFSFDKLFGIKEKTKTDYDNKSKGKETSIERTRRLFYVICSRAEESLAIIVYTLNPELAHRKITASGWFKKDEIVSVSSDGQFSFDTYD